jgi:protein-S-isoprenylcysteine O-methyltransferase Ste14
VKDMGSSFDAVIKLLAVAVIVAVVLQLVFYFWFQTFGYDSILLAITLIITVLVGFAILLFWKFLKRTMSQP